MSGTPPARRRRSFRDIVADPRTRLKYLPQYLFFVRYPLVLGLAFLAFPLIAPWKAPAILGNLFQLDWRGIAIVIFYACLCAWSIEYTRRVIWVSTPLRVGLLIDGDDHENWKTGAYTHPQLDTSVVTPGRATASLLLVLPLMWTLFGGADASRAGVVKAVAGGVAAAVAARLLGSAFALIPPPRIIPEWILSYTPYGTLYAPRSFDHSKYLAAYRVLHWRALLFGMFAIAIFLGTGFLAKPWSQTANVESWDPFTWSIPALAYLIALFMVLVWVLGFVAFMCDRLRIPTIPLIVTTLVVWTILRPFDHRYPVSEWRNARLDSRAALAARVAKDAGTLVIVAASGGGITASLWTTHVFQRLGQEIPGFHEQVTLISAVSGGAVGSLYYVDGFTDGSVPMMEEVVAASGESSLSAAVWGFAFLDVHRTYLGRLLGIWDRGWALEQRWGTHLADSNRTLGAWTDGIRAGWRPIALFNATVQETGERLILSPVTIEPRQASGRRDLAEMLPGRDLKLVTAARLSATFPYVSPHSRPDVAPDFTGRVFRAVDGGYYDNSGIVSALDVVNEWLRRRGRAATKIALVEIRASGMIDQGPLPDLKRDTLARTVSAPIETLLRMRATSQLARNQVELTLVQKVWKSDYDVDLGHFTFRLSDDQPLSWHLTAAQRKQIRNHWPETADEPAVPPVVREAAADNRRAVESLRAFLDRRQP
ncbi:MAG TPA: patatin-like phospholipase family protein [Vicinamibacterales bacterium]|nr:patatin-like phospholipase family protein [Vicinamibacterales bacterium]